MLVVASPGDKVMEDAIMLFKRSRALQRRSRSGLRHGRGLVVEPLEKRALLYNLSGQAWDHANLSFSFVPDGTVWDFGSSALFSRLDQIAPKEVWQREVARAFQTWANQTNLNFHQVVDQGGGQFVGGQQGDIRLASTYSQAALAYAYSPSRAPHGGDITLNASDAWSLDGPGATLFPVLLHELGHALGLKHEFDVPARMGYGYSEYRGLYADDIAGIQAIYGPRLPDSFDAAATNDAPKAATQLQMGASGSVELRADLTSHADVDYFRFNVGERQMSMTVAVDPRGLSLLAPAVSIYDARGALLGRSTADYGEAARIELTGLQPGATYFVQADGATDDEFGMGAYRLRLDVTAMPSATAINVAAVGIQPIPSAIERAAIEVTPELLDTRQEGSEASTGHSIAAVVLPDTTDISAGNSDAQTRSHKVVDGGCCCPDCMAAASQVTVPALENQDVADAHRISQAINLSRLRSRRLALSVPARTNREPQAVLVSQPSPVDQTVLASRPRRLFLASARRAPDAAATDYLFAHGVGDVSGEGTAGTTTT
jgi:hypothetical protein